MNGEHGGSRFGFIRARAGFAIGLGNIRRFPEVVGENDGGAVGIRWRRPCRKTILPPRSHRTFSAKGAQ
jgi:hypothetical protein